MKTMVGTLKAILATALFATGFASAANAQCVSPKAYKRSALMLRQRSWTGKFSPVSFSLVSAAQDESPAPGVAADPIVGFWKVTFVAEGNPNGPPDGTVVDSAFSQWHSDGTEIMNSSRPPVTQSFCLGVWEKAGGLTYKLNHFAISWNPPDPNHPAGTLLGLGNIREEVTLGTDLNSFTGNFTIDQYDQSGNLQVHLTGTIQGKRITVSTTVTDVL